MKQNISVTRARTHKLKISLTGPGGFPYELVPGEKLIFGVKKTLTDSNYAIIKTVEYDAKLEDGTYPIELTPSDTESLIPNTAYFYDIGLQSGSAYYSIIDTSKIYLEGNVTKKEAQ